MAAMPEELAAIVEEVSAAEVVTLGGRSYHRGAYAGEPVVVVVSRIGKVAAATTAAILLERFRPRAVVMTGLAGAIDPRLAIGDVVIAERLIHHDLDVRPLFPRHEVPLLGISELVADRALADRLEAAARGFVAPPELVALGVSTPRVWRGLVASGDQFFASTEAVAELRARLPATLAVEMEGAAVAQVCHEHGIPFAIARVISDTADHAAAVEFTRFLTVACGPYARALVRGVLGPP
ncbi:MAG: 5'-methylthioadenosine/adenosylhomocysteine nucleosidase [Kofleriaceae bacterium]